MAQFKVLKDFYLKDQDRIITDRDTITINDEATIAKLTESGHIEEIKTAAEPTQEQLQNDFEQTGADAGAQTQTPTDPQQPGNIEL